MNILLLGGTNFIGPAAAKALYTKGCKIHLFHRGKTPYEFPFPVNHIYGDRNNLSSYRPVFEKLAPDAVIDMGAFCRQDAQNLVKTFHGITPHLVVISSCDVYKAYERLWNITDGPIEPENLVETSALRDTRFPARSQAKDPDDWLYNYDKIDVEEYIRDTFTASTTILRLPMVYGPHDFSRIWGYLKRLDDSRPVLLDEGKAGWKFSRGYVEDVGEAIALATLAAVPVQQPRVKIYNISEEQVLTEEEWIQAIAKAASKPLNLVKLPSEKMPPHLKETLYWPQNLTTSSALIRKELNYKELLPFEERLKCSIGWVRGHECQQSNLLTSIDYEAEDKAI